MKKRRITTIIEELDDNGNVISTEKDVQEIVDRGYTTRQCANYLIQFFFKTEKRYTCSRTKIGKLLSILAFKYKCKGIELLDEPIYRYPGCGTAIKSMQIFDSDMYFYFSSVLDDKKTISKEQLNHNVDIPVVYRDIGDISIQMKKDIEDVFYTFGAYSQVDLGELLNPIVEYEGVCLPDGTISLSAIANLDKSKFLHNKVVEYIFQN